MNSRTMWQLLSVTAALALACGGCKAGKKNDPDAAKPDATKPVATKQAELSTAFPARFEDWREMGYRLDWIGLPFLGSQPGARLVNINAFSDIIAAQIDDSTVSVLDAANGERRWSTDLTGPLTKWVGMTRDPADSNRLMVASESEAFVLAVSTSNLLVRERFARVVNTAPIWIGRNAYFGTNTGEILAHVVGRGIKQWGFMASGSIDAQPVTIGDTLASVSAGGDVTFLSLDGTLRGRNRVLSAVVADPVTDGNSFYIASLDQSVWAFEPNGRQLWRHRTAGRLTTSPTVWNGTVFVDVPGAGLVALDAATGQAKWGEKGGDGSEKSRAKGTVIATRAGRLLVHDASGNTLTLVDPETGDIVKEISIKGIDRIVTDTFNDGALYAVSGNLRVAKFTANK